jgi:hypothetical protein
MIAARDILALLALLAALAVVSLLIFAGVANAQTASCTSLTIGQSQDITAFSVCKKVTLNSVPPPSAGVAGICVPTNIDAAQWASFYNNPPTGVTIADCSGGCTGYSYGGYCYYHSGDLSTNSCDTTCASYGGCNAAGTRYIGSDDSSGSRCGAVATALAGTSLSAAASTGADPGCGMNTFKGGWIVYNYYTPTTTCASTASSGRICACNGTGGSAPCNLPWGGTVAHGASVTAYVASAGTPGCTSQTRTCTNGVLSGSYTAQSCTAGCSLPWGGYIASGASVTAYQNPSAPCTSQTRTCTAGSLSGSYTNQSCAAGCGGYSYAGYCYYPGGYETSCTSACASRGGCSAAGTDRIGINGSNADCQAVADAIGMQYDVGVTNVATSDGCSAQVGARSIVRLRRATASQSCGTVVSTGNRVCACNN